MSAARLVLPIRASVAAAIAVIGTSVATRSMYDSVNRRNAEKEQVHPDKSAVTLNVTPQVERQVAVITENGQTHLVGQHKYSQIVHAQVEELEAVKSKLKEEASKSLTANINKVFDEVEGRSDKFAGWYFAYATTFKLLREASTSVARHAIRFSSDESLSDAVAHDLEQFLTRKYERLVLQPELTDPQLRKAYTTAVQSTHSQFVLHTTKMHREFLEKLSEKTTHLSAPLPAEVSLDWGSQMYKVRSIPASYEKMPEVTLALSATGAIVGKAGAAAGGKAAANAFVAKIASPFVSKAVLPSAGAAVGSLAGPMGSVVGVAIGVGVDYTVNKGVELVQRGEFEEDVKRVVASTKDDYLARMEHELHRAADVWVDDAVSIILQQEK